MALGRTNAAVGENLTAEINEQVNIIDALGSALAGKSGLKTQSKSVYPTSDGVTVKPDHGYTLESVYVHPASGKYAWKKTEAVIISGTLTITQLNYGSEPTEMQVTSSDVDLDLLTTESFIGSTSTVIINGNTRTYAFEVYNGNYCLKTGQEGVWTYDVYEYNPSTHIISIPKTYGGMFTWHDLPFSASTYGDSVYVLSNDASAYPDGAEQNGYYYELVV